MRRCLLLEIKRSCTNIWFFMALLSACILAVGSAAGATADALEDLELALSRWGEVYLSYSPFSCLRQWIGLDFTQPSTSIFYAFLPLLVALPFSWSLYEERKTGYAIHELIRVGRSSYYVSKYIAIGFSGSIIAIVPSVLNYLICASFLPFINPEVSDAIYWGVFADWLWSDVLYNNPVFYLVLSIMKMGLFGALWALVCASVSLLIRNRIAYTLLPFIVVIAVEYLQVVGLIPPITYSLSPLEYLRGGATAFNSNGWIILLEYTFFAVISVFSFWIEAKRDLV